MKHFGAVSQPVIAISSLPIWLGQVSPRGLRCFWAAAAMMSRSNDLVRFTLMAKLSSMKKTAICPLSVRARAFKAQQFVHHSLVGAEDVLRGSTCAVGEAAGPSELATL